MSAKIFGLHLEGLIMFNVTNDRSRSLSHICIGDSLSVPLIYETKLFFHVIISLSVAFLL